MNGVPGHTLSTSSQAGIILEIFSAHVKGFVEAVQSASNGLGLISHSSCFFSNKTQRNWLILGWWGGGKRSGEERGGSFPPFPRRRAGRVRGAHPGRRSAQPAVGAGAPDEPSLPAPARTARRGRGQRQPSLLRLRGSGQAGSAPRLTPSPEHRLPRRALPAACLRPDRGLSAGSAGGSCPRVPSGTAPHLSAGRRP